MAAIHIQSRVARPGDFPLVASISTGLIVRARAKGAAPNVDGTNLSFPFALQSHPENVTAIP